MNSIRSSETSRSTPCQRVTYQNGNLQGKMTFTSVIHAKLHRRDYVISLPSKNITNQMSDTQNAVRNLVSGTRNKTIRNWKNDHFTRIVTKYYSVVSCITDNTTYFTYQNTNRSSISHKSNYRTTWLRR